ncbi:MAG: GNAT family N-acetyltransferase [Herpetosiphonaceae bacterium]|nr:GNAT family N-acetyltransferase [Herpetosiphonaceae bacterium]
MNGRANWHVPGYAVAYSWLARDYLSNLEMILVLLHESLATLLVVGTAPAIRGVLMKCAHPFRSGDCYRIDALDSEVLNELMQHPAVEPSARWLVHRPWMQPILQQRYGIVPSGFGIRGFATTTASTIPRDGRPLGGADRALVEWSDCGWSAADFDQLLQGRRPWAIVHDDLIICRASAGYDTPWTAEVLGLWTHPAYRKRGLARSLVAAICDDILARKPIAAYSTTFENLASQHVARAVGLKHVTTITECTPG